MARFPWASPVGSPAGAPRLGAVAADASSGAVGVVALWYLASFAGVVLNKQLLAPGGVAPITLAFAQTSAAVLLGAGMLPRTSSRIGAAPSRASLGVLLGLGLLRSLVVLLGLISLRHVAASFTETVKASSPFFTVVAAFLLTGERTDCRLLLALVPVVCGLTVASAREVSFTALGFGAAVLTNVVECVQNVFCKRLLDVGLTGGKEGELTPFQLQYFSAVASLFVQLPVFIASAWRGALTLPSEGGTVVILFAASVVYFLQSALVFQVMLRRSAVSVSVLNTAKRAMIIILSSAFFGNKITPLGTAGTAATLLGSGLYSQLRAQGAAQGSDEKARQHRRGSDEKAPDDVGAATPEDGVRKEIMLRRSCSRAMWFGSLVPGPAVAAFQAVAPGRLRYVRRGDGRAATGTLRPRSGLGTILLTVILTWHAAGCTAPPWATTFSERAGNLTPPGPEGGSPRRRGLLVQDSMFPQALTDLVSSRPSRQ